MQDETDSHSHVVYQCLHFMLESGSQIAQLSFAYSLDMRIMHHIKLVLDAIALGFE